MLKKHYTFVTTDLGIGDIICTMYALNGFLRKRGYPKSTLYMRDHWWWPQMMDIPHLECVNIRDKYGVHVERVLGKIVRLHGPVDEALIERDPKELGPDGKPVITGYKGKIIAEENKDAQGNILVHTWDTIGQDKTEFDYCLGDSGPQYTAKLAEGPDWKQWYARKLEGDTPLRPTPKAEVYQRNQFKDGDLKMEGNFVLLSPFATRPNRTWDIPRWAFLARYLQTQGLNVYALDGPGQGDRVKFVGVPFWYGAPPLWVARAVMQAKLLIGNESGMAHLAGWLGTPCIVLAAQLNCETQYSMTGVTSMYSEAKCIRCQFQVPRGYDELCNFSCAALQLIRPRDVAEKALELIGPIAKPAEKS